MLTEGDYLVLDANGTDGVASFQLPNPDPDGDGTTAYSVFARALGTPGGQSFMTTCAYDATNTKVCSLTTTLKFERKPGERSTFANVSKNLLYIYNAATGTRVPLFDQSLQGYFWEYDNQGLKLAQLRFYDARQRSLPARTRAAT